MSATIISGKFFSPNQVVHDVDLHQIVENATVSSLGADETANNAAVVFIGGSSQAPSATKHVFSDTTLSLLKVHDGTRYVPLGGRAVYLANQSGGDLIRGDIVVISTSSDDAFTTTTSANNVRAIGILAENIKNTESGVVLTHGPALVNFVSFSASGVFFLSTSTTAGKALQSASATNGTLGVAMVSSSTSPNLVPCFLFGGPVQSP